MVKICAHRGSSRRYPENTLLAFDAALREGADMLEFDIRRTQDGQCVIMHDANVDRTTNGRGSVRTLTYAKVRKLDAGQGQRVPNLEESLDYGQTMLLNIQVYADDDEDGVAIADTLSAYFQDSVLQRNAFVTAHNQALLQRLREQRPSIRLCNLQHRHNPNAAVDQPPASQVLQPQVKHVSEDMVRTAHARGLKVNVYFADDLATARRLISLGVDGILTNDPALLVAIR